MFNTLTKTLSQILFNCDNMSAYFAPFSARPPAVVVGDMYAAEVSRVKIDSSTIYSITLAISGKVGGRYFDFKPGQYVDLLVQFQGRYIKRAFSIASSLAQYNTDKTITLTIRKQHGGRITPWLADALQVGEQLGISAAKGEFTLATRAGEKQHVIFIAGGIGITPFYSLLSSHLHASPTIKFTLLYYAKADEHVLIYELRQLVLKYANFELRLMQTERDGHCTKAHITDLSASIFDSDLYLCGPETMIKSTRTLLLAMGVVESAVYSEQFGTVDISGLDISEARQITFVNSNKVISVQGEKPQSLLIAAESNAVPAKYGCRVGICQECKCRKISGSVYNSKTGQYSDLGEEDIQLCISVPVTDVSINL